MNIVYFLLGISPVSMYNMPTFRNLVSVPWFQNVGILYIDTGEIPKRKYTIFISRRKLEIYLPMKFFHMI